MSDLFKNKFRIDSTRLPFKDYTEDGIYFITICTEKRKLFFGKIRNYEMQLNQTGKTVNQNWLDIPKHFSGVYLDAFIVMPNHIHRIISIQINYGKFVRGEEKNDLPRRDKACLVSTGRDRWQNPGKGSLSTIVGSFKSACTRQINKQFPNLNFKWQPRYWDHIIRNEKSLDNIRDYIYANPYYWEYDRNHPRNIK